MKDGETRSVSLQRKTFPSVRGLFHCQLSTVANSLIPQGAKGHGEKGRRTEVPRTAQRILNFPIIGDPERACLSERSGSKLARTCFSSHPHPLLRFACACQESPDLDNVASQDLSSPFDFFFVASINHSRATLRPVLNLTRIGT